MATYTGLHHHGDEHGKAGYTVHEILQLCTSTFLPQRTLMLGILGKMLARRHQHPEHVRAELEKAGFTQKAVGVIGGVLCSSERNAGVLREAIDALYSSLPQSALNLIHGKGLADEAFIEDEQSLGPLRKWTLKVPIEAILERLAGLLNEPVSTSPLSPPSIYKAVGVVFAISLESTDTSAKVPSVFISRLVRNLVNQFKWPAVPAHTNQKDQETERDIALLVIRLLRSCTTASRVQTKELLGAGTYDILLKFLLLSPWHQQTETLTRPATLTARQGWHFAGLVIDTYEKIARYGLNGPLLSTTSEIWVSLGTWVHQHFSLATALHSETLYAVESYLNLLRVWLVSAKDPHSMETEHDLIWSQIQGFGWKDEAEHILRVGWSQTSRGLQDTPVELWGTVGAALGVLEAWIDGSAVNAEKSGIEQRDEVRNILKDLETVQTVRNWMANFSEIKTAEEISTMSNLVSLLSKVKMPIWSDAERNLAESALAKVDRARAENRLAQGHARIVQSLNVLAYRVLSSLSTSDPSDFAQHAIKVIEAAQPGEEDHVMRLVDKILDLPWPAGVIEQVGHRHGLYILRPFLHYVILPNLDALSSPVVPLSNMLRATVTLRWYEAPPPVAQNGLPLRSDWMFAAIEQYLRPQASPVFSQLPPAWNASRLEVVRATLLLCQVVGQIGNLADTESRSPTLLNAIKVFLIESVPDPEGTEEIFRDGVVSRLLSEMVAPCLHPAQGVPDTRLDQVAASVTPPGTTFFQIYSDFVHLFDAMSLGDTTFAQLVLVPLSQNYPVDYRQLVWSEQSSTLRSLQLNLDQVILESGSIDSYFQPVEENADMLFAYCQALAKGWVVKDRQPFLYSVAIHHLQRAMARQDSQHAKLSASLKKEVSAEIQEEIFETSRVAN